jgi:hypothetical protein
MRTLILVIMALMAAPVARAQGTQPSARPSTSATGQSAAEDAGEVLDDVRWQLPVSLERIREELARIPAKPVLQGLEPQADFRVTIEERRFDVDLLENFDVGNSPPPPAGLYGYEMQRITRDPVSHPLEQPYAAFTQGELLQVAATSTIAGLLTQYFTEGLTRSTRARQERAAREEVKKAIAAYCAAQTQGSAVTLCIATLTRE